MHRTPERHFQNAYNSQPKSKKTGPRTCLIEKEGSQEKLLEEKKSREVASFKDVTFSQCFKDI